MNLWAEVTKQRRGWRSLMNQSIEQQNNSTKQIQNVKWSRQKKQAVAAVVVALIAIAAVPVIAWFYHQRSMQTITRINAPNALQIGGPGENRAIANLELSEIDVSEPGFKDVVFCVYSARKCAYDLQLAYTTNIDFGYSIFPAQKNNQGGSSTVSSFGETYFFKADNPITLNRVENSHNKTYGNYNEVQTKAEPQYWKASDRKLPDTSDNGYHVDYYVLRISWGENFQNDKETDMVYIMAKSK